MKRDLPPYVYRKKGGHLWFVRRGWQSTRIHAAYPSPEFYAELAAIQRGIPKVSGNRTFSNLIASYMRSERWTSLAPRTRADYQKVLTLVDDRMGRLDPTRMQRKDVIRLQESNRSAVRFANYCVQVMAVLMEHAIDIGWRPSGTNPAKGVRLIKGPKRDVGPWSPEMIAAFRAAAPPRARLVFELCIGTGQRIGDVLKMQWSDVRGDVIFVRQGKTDARLELPLTPDLRTILADSRRSGLFIVAKSSTAPISYRIAHQDVMAVRKEIGAETHTLHDLRHTTASELAALGLDDPTIMAVTGHRSLASVRRYTEAARQKARARIAIEMRTRGRVIHERDK